MSMRSTYIGDIGSATLSLSQPLCSGVP